MSDTGASRHDPAVDLLLLEAGMDDDGQLRDALLDLRSLAADAPEPSADIAALMAGASTAGPATTVLPAAGDTATSALPAARPVDELAARRRARRRITLTTLSVAASLAAGGAVAAASDQGIRDSFTQLNHAVTAFVTGSSGHPLNGGSTPGQPAPQPAAPAHPAATSTDAAPAATATAPAPAAVAPSNVPAPAGTAPGNGAAARKPADVPAQPSLPADIPGEIGKGLEQEPKLPVPVPTEVPLPGSVPDVPLR